jgi:hypothetical protein
MLSWHCRLRWAALAVTLLLIAARPAFQISNDRELKEIDLAGWDCPEGAAKTPDGLERNRLKNRSAPSLPGSDAKPLDTASFLKLIADFEAKTKNKRRKDLTLALQQQLDELEKQSVALTGYLVLAYAGPTESTNCGSVDFHDWHLELFEKPQDHAPQPGDPTPIVCEISPRTQNAIYRDGIRIQELASFFRRADLEVEPAAPKAKQIRVTGYLLWDDEHNGKADVGPTIDHVGANKYHQPWRSTAWEIHPVYKIDVLDTASVNSARPVPAPAAASPGYSPPPGAAPRPQMVTLTQPVKIKIPYGETTLPAGAQLSVVSQDAKTVTVRYMGGNYVIPITSTDLH